MHDAMTEDVREKKLKLALDFLLPQADTRPVPPTGCKEESSFEAHATTLFVVRKTVQHVPQKIWRDQNTSSYTSELSLFVLDLHSRVERTRQQGSGAVDSTTVPYQNGLEIKKERFSGSRQVLLHFAREADHPIKSNFFILL